MKKYSPTYIDNLPYAVVVPSMTTWFMAVDCVSAVYDGALKHFHCDDMQSWCSHHLPPMVQLAGGRFMASESAEIQDMRSEHVGYRPVLIPLNPDTLEPDSTRLDNITDGVILSMGSLYLDGKAVSTTYLGENYTENTPRYTPGQFIQIGDSALDIYSRINFVKCRDFLIADRNILKNVSWSDLDKCGLILGNGISDPRLFYEKPSLDKLISDALMASQEQISERLTPTMEQALKDNLIKRLEAKFER